MNRLPPFFILEVTTDGFKLLKLATSTKVHVLISDLLVVHSTSAIVIGSAVHGAKIAEKNPNATYVHCCSHVLNLAFSSS
jgi:predicted metallopeptidase